MINFNNKKTKRIFTMGMAIILILAMVVTTIVYAVM